jgi:DNA-binding SARP family transcriptional activator
MAVARWAEPTDWQAAAHHWMEADRGTDVLRVVEANLETIVASGAFSLAAEFFASVRGHTPTAASEVIASRQASHEGDLEQVVAHAESAAVIDPRNDVVVANLIASNILTGNLVAAGELAESLRSSARSPLMRKIGAAVKVLFQATIDGDVLDAAQLFVELAEESRASSHGHFEGVSELNAAIALIPAGAFGDAATHAQSAIDTLSTTRSGNELKSAQYAKAAALAYGGNLEGARGIFAQAAGTARHAAQTEYLVEHADVESQLGNPETARRLLEGVSDRDFHAMAFHWTIARAALDIRDLDVDSAVRDLEAIDRRTPAAHPAYATRVLTFIALAKAIGGRPDAPEAARIAAGAASRQRASLWQALATIVEGALEGRLSEVILTTPRHLQCVTSIGAELVLQHLGELDGESRSIVVEEALVRPDRWLPSIRRSLGTTRGAERAGVAMLLSEVGQQVDVASLRMIGRSKSATSVERRLSRELARRLAPRVVVRDLGRVTLRVGEVEREGQEIRRKVLALLCYLLTKPRFSATREEVMEAMWPDMDPSAAINSLNQSVYFLRRVFEPEYTEDSTAGYVRQDSDLLWLDTELIEAVSGRCAALVAEYERSHDAAVVFELSQQYRERFALDFMYDEWATDFRDWLHVSCLRVIEEQIRALLDAGDHDSGIAMARRAVLTDPRNEELEASLLRLLRGSGAHAAAAEQYAHYATMLKRDLGVEAPRPSDL